MNHSGWPQSQRTDHGVCSFVMYLCSLSLSVEVHASGTEFSCSFPGFGLEHDLHHVY